MKYGDLFMRNPIETVIQLERADRKSEARRLVESFVITPSFGESIETVAILQLDFESGSEYIGAWAFLDSPFAVEPVKTYSAAILN